MLLRRLYKKIARHTLQPTVRRYLRKERRYRYKGMDITVLPGVFHPGFFISTKLLIRFLDEKNLIGKSLLELGCGSGMVSVFAAMKGAVVTASDINPKAVENTLLNAERNGVLLQVVQSDLFTQLPELTWDYIVINPPYYPRTPINDAERAWYCGEGFEYFVKLFDQLVPFAGIDIWLILSEDCDLQRISGIAKHAGWVMDITWQGKRRGERNWIFVLRRQQ